MTSNAKYIIFAILVFLVVLLLFAAGLLIWYFSKSSCSTDTDCNTTLCETCQNGTCLNSCDSEQCESCQNGKCTNLCDSATCESCQNGKCSSMCTLSETCAGGACYTFLNNTTDVYGELNCGVPSSDKYIAYGKTSNIQNCAAKCSSDSKCTGVTWHNNTFISTGCTPETVYQEQCYGLVGGTPTNVPQTGATSAKRIEKCCGKKD